jgi:TalC/MipB family fructose-6-phosphate aldolase
MEIWLDTLDADRIQAAAVQGILHGVTTNPSLLANSPERPIEALNQLLKLQRGPVAVQVTAHTTDDMIREASQLREQSERFVIKIPATPAGLAAIRCLSADHIPTMATAIFHPNQVLLAATAGAHYAAPYLKRMAAYGQEAFEELAFMQQIIDDYRFSTKIIAASIADIQVVHYCLALRVAAITMPAELYDKLAAPHPHTTEAVKQFEKDWGNRNFL